MNFTVDMDIPLDGNLLLDNDAINLMEGFSPVYISSITYGRNGSYYNGIELWL